MAKKSQFVQIGKRKIEISNLDKILFPESKISKAEVIHYYLNIAPTILRHIKGRPLSLIRYPEGIHQEKFYQKNRPQWAPQWIDHIKLGSNDKKDYIMATEEASLAWLSNLACLELHQMHVRKPHFDQPDYFVLDLDPPENYNFKDIVGLAFDLKEQAELFGYHPFVKTTGGKGVHLLIPVEPKWDSHQVFEAAKDLVQPFVEKNNKTTTLHIKKEARKGRVLVDIFRNRSSQTIVAPYSLRGFEKGPVSMPVTWDQLADLTDPKYFNMSNVLDFIIEYGDPWEGMAAYAVPLHTEVKEQVVKKRLQESSKHKSPDQLQQYQKKRDFSKTPEPGPDFEPGHGNAFVIHRHHATRLHYDLRLEEEGVLKSWAVPKGMPQRPGVKRMAVATEDHPLEYLHFEGRIPKGQYGAGPMWVYATGKYEYVKKKKNGFYFNIYGKQLNAEYRMHQTKDNEWLLERVDQPQIDWLSGLIDPMLAESSDIIPTGNYIYEVKWDGIRALIYIDEGNIRIMSRNKRDITGKFPELLDMGKAFRATNAVFDGEIVCLDEIGRPDFGKVITRMQQSGQTNIERSVRTNPVYCYLFDCLYLDGRPIVQEPFTRRHEWLKDTVKINSPYRVSETEENGTALFEAATQMGLEGIMAKEKNSRYLTGKRSDCWQKIKVRKTTDCYIIGYTQGKGDREPYFGGLQLGQYDEEELIYRGKVGTGFDQKKIKKIYNEMQKLPEIKKPVKAKPADAAKTTWIEPKLICEIQYSSLTKNGTYREPVFLHLRPDLIPQY